VPANKARLDPDAQRLQLDALASDAPEPSEAGSGPQRVAAADALSPTRLTR
jgi:hypothetical protein